MLTLTHRQPQAVEATTTTTKTLILALTAEERKRSRHLFTTDDGMVVCLRLARGTVLHDGDILLDQTGQQSVRIIAKPEPLLTVTASNSLDLCRAAYHLGNRHVAVEITPTYLRLSPDSVLQAMLENLGLQVFAETVPFHPELGAYGHHHHS